MKSPAQYEAMASKLDAAPVRSFEPVEVAFPTAPTAPTCQPGESALSALLRPVSVVDVLTNPAPPPIYAWEGYLPCGEVSLLAAHGGVGKSTIALMLTVATVTGRPLFGIPTRKMPAVFLSLEDGARIVRHRLSGICRAWGIDPRLLADLHIVDGTENPELFQADGKSAGATTPTYAELLDLAATVRPGLVVVDNASDAFGGDEINRRQVRGFVRALKKVAQLSDSSVCLLAHVDKATTRQSQPGGEAYSGSTAWHNGARSRLFMAVNSGLLTLEHQKNNHGKKRDPLTLTWPEGGLPELVDDAADFDPQNLTVTGRADDAAASALLRLITEFEAREQYASPLQTARNNVYALLRSEPAFQRLKLSRDATTRIVTQCQRAGWIEPLDYRTVDRKDRKRWTVTPKGREFVGLSAPTAPTAPTCHESALSAKG